MMISSRRIAYRRIHHTGTAMPSSWNGANTFQGDGQAVRVSGQGVVRATAFWRESAVLLPLAERMCWRSVCSASRP